MAGRFMTTQPKKDEQYSESEAQQRFKDLAKRALNTPPKTLKSMGPKGMPSQSKKRRKRTKRAA
jgi:hypothetical protein